ncbi:MAG: aminopeptidase P family protein [Deltaproteobacteria bacterium]|nr:aminopeptidase P family protein [Deltaproteobacteria bacterium]
MKTDLSETSVRTERLAGLKKVLAQAGLSGVLLSQSRDIFYYTGTAQPSYLLVWPQGCRLFVKSGLELALQEARIDPAWIEPERRLEVIGDIVRQMVGRAGALGLELDVLTANQFFTMAEVFQGFELKDASSLILEQRKTKDPLEVEALRRACRAIDSGHQRVRAVLRPGQTELELAAAIEEAHRLAGHEGTFFMRQPDFFMSRGLLASGPNLSRFNGMVYSVTGVGLSPAMSIGPSRRRMGPGDLVVIDVPVMVNGYHADMTRTYHLGPASAETRRMFETLEQIFDQVIEGIRPGLTGAEVYQAALDQARELGQEERFLSFGHGQQAQMIGHGVGLEINEPPILSSWDQSPIGENFVLAVEMHILDPEGRLAKLEDMILIGQDKNEILTTWPRDLFEV